MKRTANTLSISLITVLLTTLAWAIDGTEEQEHKLKLEAMGLQVPEAAPALEQEKSITIRATSKAYSGFQGTVVTPKPKQYPEGAEGAIMELLDHWDKMSFEDAAKAQEKLNSLIREMSYEELKDIYEGNPNNSTIENAMYLSWLATQRSGENGFRVSRSSGTEVEPNDDMSTATAMATDTVSAYITAYDEDWYSFTVSSGGDWTIETHATSADDNVGDTKLYLYAASSSTNYVEYDDDGGSGSYSKITHRFDDAVTPTSNLFFSEYAEGSSNNKYLEIYNGTGAEVSLDQYVILGNYNGNPWSEAFTFAAGATIETGSVYVIANSSANSAIIALADEVHAYGNPWYTLSFNGDDVRALAQISGSDTTIIDIIGTLDGDGDGVPGEGSEDDPGSGFDVAGTSNATKDYTLVRKGSVLSGNASWSASAGTSTTDSEWEVADRPTASYTPSTLGSHTITAANEYYIKVAPYSSSYAGAYLLTVVSGNLPTAYGAVIINEINYNGPESGTDTTEFIELYNISSSAVDLSGVDFNEGVTFTFPSGASIAAGGYLVTAYDSSSFHNRFGFAADYEWTSGGLSNSGEDIELVDSAGARVDYVDFEDGSYSTEIAAGWDPRTDGGGPTYELIDPASDNNLGTSWRGWGVTGGTPGAANSAQPDLSAGSSISGYLAVGSSMSDGFQLNNNGDADLTVSAVTVDSQYVPGTTLSDEGFESGIPSDWTATATYGSYNWASSTTYANSGSYSVSYNSYYAYYGYTADLVSASYDLSSASSPILSFAYLHPTTASYYTDSITVYVSSDDGTNWTRIGGPYMQTGYTWGTESISLASHTSTTVKVKFIATSDYGQRLYLDDVSIASAGVNIDPTVGGAGVPAWISVSAPSADIAAGDSGDVTVTFNAGSISSSASYSTTVNVINNDPQDSSYSFTATINALADTAVLDISSGAGDWLIDIGAVGDTVDEASITIQNDGGASLVVDSASLADGTHYYHDLADSTVIAANETASFKVYYAPQAVGTHLDTLAFNDNTDSTSGESLTFDGYGHAATDTLWAFTDGDDDVSWTLTSGSYSFYHSSSSGYFYGIDGYAVSPRVALDSASTLHFTFRNANASTFDVRIFYSTDKDATVWTGWTAVDTITVATSGVSGTSKYSRHEVSMHAAADTGYVGVQLVAPSDLVYYSYWHDVVMPPRVAEPVTPSAVPAGYTLEGFEGSTFPPEEWTNTTITGHAWEKSSSYAQAGSYSAKFKGSGYSGYQGELITPVLDLTGSSTDSLIYYLRNASWAGDQNECEVLISPDLGTTWTTITTHNTSITSFTRYAHDLEAYTQNDETYIKFVGVDNYGYGVYLDEVLIPWELAPTAELTLSDASLDFYSLAVDTAAGTGSHSLDVDVINTGQDTLRGSIVSGSAAFTASSDTVDLVPGDTLVLTVTYAPSTFGDDSSGITFYSNNGGVTDTTAMMVEGSAVEADSYDHFEFADYETSGFTRYNTDGGVYWTDATSSGSSGSNSVRAVAHKWGGESWLVTPTFTASADGERLTWEMKVDDATPDANTTVFLMKVSGNTYADLAGGTKLDSFTVGSSGGDMTTSWQTYFVDDYGVSGSLIYAFKFVDSDDAANSSADAADVYIDNIYFADAPSVPIVNLAGSQDEDVVLVEDGFDFDGVNLAQNTGGDTLFIDSIWTSDANLTVTLESDTVPKQSYVTVDYTLDADSIVMGSYGAFIYFSHNDTLFSSGTDTVAVKADFADHFEDFEDGDLGTLLSRDRDGDGYGWTASMISNGPNGSYGAYSNKASSTAISDNVLKTRLHDVTAGDKFIFHAKYTSSSDPDYMHVRISNDLGSTWTGLDTVSMMGKASWARYEYDLASYVGDVVRFAIVDVNYGNSISDKLWVDRVMLPDRAAIGTIASYRTMNADSTYAFEDSVFTIRGVVTAAGTSFGSSGPAYMQDSTGGIAVYDSDFADSAMVGDKVIVKGTGDVYSNLFEITSVSYIITEQGVSVSPEVVSLSSLSGTTGEGLEGQFLKIEDVTWVDESDWGSWSFNMEVTDGTDTITVRIDSDADIDTMVTGSLDIVGVLGQYSSSDPYDGFQLLPRMQDDLTGYHRISGTVTDASSGDSLSGVDVELGAAETATGADGAYIIRELGDYTDITFSKDGYSDAVFAVNVSTGGFSTLDVAMHYALDSLLATNSFETSGSEGAADTSVATGTQWLLSGALDVSVRSSTGTYTTETVTPTDGSTMLIVTDTSVAGTGVGGYASNSYSLWILPEVVDLSGFTTDLTLTMSVWVNSETNYDDFRVLIKSDADTSDTWTVIDEIRGGYNDDWDEIAIDLGAVDTLSDARIALLYDSDASVTNGFGVAVDDIMITSWDGFVALAPADLEATSMVAGQVALTWGAPGTDSTTLNIPTMDVHAFLDVEEIVRHINAQNSNENMTVEQWMAEALAHNPRFNTHPRVQDRSITYLPQRTMDSSRDLASYNIFRRAAGADFALLDSSTSTSFTDASVTDYTYYYYNVTAVYDEGESDHTDEVLGVPGAVTDLTPDLSESFETISTGETLPDGWTTFNDGVQDVDWIVGDDAVFGSYTVPSHSDYAYIDGYDYGYQQNVASTLISPFYDFSDAEGAILTFDSYAQSYSASYNEMLVAYRIGYGEWNILADLSYDHSDWESHEVFVGDEIMGEEHVQLGIIYDDGDYYNYGWAVDNVNLMDVRAVASLSIDSIEVINSDNSDTDSLSFTISNVGDWSLEYDIELDLSDDDMLRNVEGSTITPEQNYFETGNDIDMALTLYNNSPDTEWINEVRVTFPTGVEVNSATDFYISSTRYLAADSSMGDGATVTWDDPDGGYGEIYGGESVTCTVNVDISDDIGHQLTADYTIYGDVWGAEPHIISDSFTLFDIVVSFDPSSGTVDAGRSEDVDVSIEFVTTGIWEGDVVMTTTDPNQPEIYIPVLIRTDNAPGEFALREPTDGDTLTIMADADSLSVSWGQSDDPDGDDVIYSLTIQGLPLSAGMDTLDFVDTVLTADMFGETADHDLLIQEIITIFSGMGATPTYVTIDWDVEASDDMMNTTPSSNGPFTVTLDLGWLMGTDDEPAIPDVFSLHQNYPNPFNPYTTIRYDVPEQARVTMEVYDVLGRKVRTLVNHRHQPGYHAVIWNGQDDRGVPVATGMYIYKVTAQGENGSFTSVKKLIMMK